MDMGWSDLVHLAIYDLTLKTSRKFHDYDADIMPHILSNWKMFQLYKHHNALTEDQRKGKTKECLILEKETFESGAESRQEVDGNGNFWEYCRIKFFDQKSKLQESKE